MHLRSTLYCLLLYTAVFILTCVQFLPRSDRKTSVRLVYESTTSFHVDNSRHSFIGRDVLLPQAISNDNRVKHWPTDPSLCRMDTCFNFTRCLHGFKVYVYPSPEDVIISKSYKNILDIVKASQYYTTNPDDACIYISGVDTLDRDLRSVNYIEGLQQKLESLPHWNNGVNHLIFNLYSGTWPNYTEKFGINVGYAMLAKASISTYSFRAGFDISLPLFHETLPIKAGQQGLLSNMNIPSKRQYLIAFKGKRYLTGIGSESRNNLYHMHNGLDIIMLTTCKHGKGWEKFADDRCTIDNDLYDKYDYEKLLIDSTFCLVPRGRRLGSYRFLEVLRYGCVPVLLSDSWELPFSDVIDWKQAAIWADEDQMFQIPYWVRSIPHTSIVSLQQQTQHLWSNYFNSLNNIILTTLQIIKDRVEPENSLPFVAWHTHPGPDALTKVYSKDFSTFPFFTKTSSNDQFTVLIYISDHPNHLRKSLENLSTTEHIKCVYIIILNRPDLTDRITIITHTLQSLDIKVIAVNSFKASLELFRELPTDAVMFIFNYDATISKELSFTFSVWKEYPARIVGPLARSHLWHDGEKRLYFSSKISNQYSMVLLDTAIVHKYYLFKVLELSHKWMDDRVVEKCPDELINFVVSDVTKLPPVKVGQRLGFKRTSSTSSSDIRSKSNCLNTLFSKFGSLPLKYSHVRYDPALLKDNVAKTRKKYLDLELV